MPRSDRQVTSPGVTASDFASALATRMGIEVVVTREQGCCGALDHHMGHHDPAMRLARANIEAWTREIEGEEELDAIVVNASGCGTTVKDYGHMFREEPAPDAGTDTLVAYGAKVRERFRAWWQAGDTAPSKTLQTYYGPQSLHELMERTTWHSGQHVRQYMMLLEKEGVTHHRPLVAADFAKLPMPQNVWDG